MAKFNAKKIASKSYEKMLQDNNDEHGLSKDKEAVNFNATLEKDRKPNDGDEPIQKALEDVRVADSDLEITEGQLNNGVKGWMKTRDDSGEHPMDYHKKTEKEYTKAYNAAQKKTLKKVAPISEENVGEDIDKDKKTKIVSNDQRSQLFSNYDSREDFRKKNRSMKKASVEALFDADAVLYHIYRTASTQKRELTASEQETIDRINDEKITILASEYAFTEEAQPNIGQQDQQIMSMDDKESVAPQGASQGSNPDDEFAALGDLEDLRMQGDKGDINLDDPNKVPF
jgi:hypothetical protein